MDSFHYIEQLCLQAKQASRFLAQASSNEKKHALQLVADQIWKEKDLILEANSKDMAIAKTNGISPAMLDRLMLNETRLSGMVHDLRHVADLPDPAGQTISDQVLPNGLHLRRQRVPLGVLAVIYEARPNVTVDVAGLSLKSGNSVILRGGSETIESNLALIASIQRGLALSAIPVEAIQLVSSTDRGMVLDLLHMDRYIDMVIPRGGAGLHDFCRSNSRIPVITGGIGICHLFVDESANLEKAIPVIRNAKVQRPTVCNALDTAVVHQTIAAAFLPSLVDVLAKDGVTFKADETAWNILGPRGGVVSPAGPLDFDTEWLSLVLGIKVVGNMDEAIEHISLHTTAHSDGILTENAEHAARFVQTVDSAAVYVNASTRFTDGGQFGLGAEIAISTQRLHARGPMGLEELTTYKWVVEGDYHVRP